MLASVLQPLQNMINWISSTTLWVETCPPSTGKGRAIQIIRDTQRVMKVLLDISFVFLTLIFVALEEKGRFLNKLYFV